MLSEEAVTPIRDAAADLNVTSRLIKIVPVMGFLLFFVVVVVNVCLVLAQETLAIAVPLLFIPFPIWMSFTCN